MRVGLLRGDHVRQVAAHRGLLLSREEGGGVGVRSKLETRGGAQINTRHTDRQADRQTDPQRPCRRRTRGGGRQTKTKAPSSGGGVMFCVRYKTSRRNIGTKHTHKYNSRRRDPKKKHRHPPVPHDLLEIIHHFSERLHSSQCLRVRTTRPWATAGNSTSEGVRGSVRAISSAACTARTPLRS